ncbi:MAG: hypothetical protein ACREGC_01820, partial [Minisyncoccia bacterium]
MRARSQCKIKYRATMSSSSNGKQFEIKSSAIIFGALIGIGFWVTLGAFVGALSMSLDLDSPKLPSAQVLIAVACMATLVFTSTFLIAGFIVSKVAHQQFLFDSVIHSLGTWAAMAILLFLLVTAAAVGNGINNAFTGSNPP